MSAYRKEAVLTIGFFVAYLLMAHTAPWAIILGVDNSVRVLGFPLHYFMAVVTGWFGVLAVSIAWNYFADRLEEEIAAEGGQASPGIRDAHSTAVDEHAPQTPASAREQSR